MAVISGNVGSWEKTRTVAGVLRSYNNRDVVKAVIRADQARIGKLFVVTNAAADNGATRAWLKEAGYVESEWLEILELGDYSWAKALNAALRCIQNHNRDASIRGKNGFDFILNFSVEALFNKAHIDKMIDAASKYPNAGVIGSRFQAKKYVADTETIPLGRSYNHPRNTFMMIAINRLGHFWWTFDTYCDQIGGMEDIEFIFRMLVYTGLDSVMLDDVIVPLVVGRHYNQKDKEKREQAAMDEIIANHFRPFNEITGGECLKLKVKIIAVIKEMRLQ